MNRISRSVWLALISFALAGICRPYASLAQAVMEINRVQMFFGTTYGFPCETREMRNGKVDGLCIVYGFNGMVRATYWKSQDVFVGICEEFHDNGRPQFQIHYCVYGPPTWETDWLDTMPRYGHAWRDLRDENRGLRDGPTFEFNSSGKLIKRTEWRNGSHTGVDSSWYQWDTVPYLLETTSYLNFQREGLQRWYRKNGSCYRSQTFHKNILSGPFWEYHDNGNLACIGRNAKGHRDSIETHFREDGSTHSRRYWANNGKTCITKEWDPQGRLQVEFHEQNSKMEGPFLGYDSTGRIVVRGQYTDGSKLGTWTDSSGRVDGIVKATFEAGKAVEIWVDGKPFPIDTPASDTVLPLWEALVDRHFPPDQIFEVEPEFEVGPIDFYMDEPSIIQTGKLAPSAIPERFDWQHPLEGSLLLIGSSIADLNFTPTLTPKEFERLKNALSKLTWKQDRYGFYSQRCSSERVEFRLYHTD